VSSCPRPRCARIRRLPAGTAKSWHLCRSEKKQTLHTGKPGSEVPPFLRWTQLENSQLPAIHSAALSLRYRRGVCPPMPKRWPSTIPAAAANRRSHGCQAPEPRPRYGCPRSVRRQEACQPTLVSFSLASAVVHRKVAATVRIRGLAQPYTERPTPARCQTDSGDLRNQLFELLSRIFGSNR